MKRDNERKQNRYSEIRNNNVPFYDISGCFISVIASSSFSCMSSNFCALHFRKCYSKMCLIV